MRVIVRFLGPFRRYHTGEEVSLELPAQSTVGEVLQTLGAQLGERFQEEVLGSPGRVSGLVLVNRANLPPAGWETELSDGDTISLVPPMAGG